MLVAFRLLVALRVASGYQAMRRKGDGTQNFTKIIYI